MNINQIQHAHATHNRPDRRWERKPLVVSTTAQEHVEPATFEQMLQDAIIQRNAIDIVDAARRKQWNANSN